MGRQWTGIIGAVGVLLGTACPVFAAPNPFLQQEQLQQARQEQRKRMERLENPGERQPEEQKVPEVELPSSPIRFQIDRIQMEGNIIAFPWMDRITDKYLHRELDGAAISRLAGELNQQLLDRGYVTTRVLVPEQNLNGGTLRLILQAGIFHGFRNPDGTAVSGSMARAFPIHPGEVLNLRKLEQGLEQLNRLPSQKVRMNLVPAREAFATDVELQVERTNNVYGLVSTDDSGLKSTGKSQWNTEISWDQPFFQNDRLQLDLNGDATQSGTEKGTRGQAVSYSIPYGWDTFTFSFSRYQYHQKVHLDPFPFLSEGLTKKGKFPWDHGVYRSRTQRQSLDFSIRKRDSHSYLDHRELDIQTQHTTALEAGWNLRDYLGSGVLYTRLGHRMGVAWLGAQPENPYGEGPKTRYNMWLLDVDYQEPFQLGKQKATYTASFHGQWTMKGDRLYGLDDISMGNRYTVRGFDGEYTLMGESGWVLRNEVACPVASWGEVYVGADGGAVYGPSTDILTGRTIAGGAVGLRGTIPFGNTELFYDVFAGIPLYKPQGYPTKSVTCGFSAGWRF